MLQGKYLRESCYSLLHRAQALQSYMLFLSSTDTNNFFQVKKKNPTKAKTQTKKTKPIKNKPLPSSSLQFYYPV